MWFLSKKKKKVEPVYENAYSLLNKELNRMHELFRNQLNSGGSEKNLNVFWTKINDIQDVMIRSLEKQPAHAEEIHDLQNTVAEILLLSQTESK